MCHNAKLIIYLYDTHAHTHTQISSPYFDEAPDSVKHHGYFIGAF